MTIKIKDNEITLKYTMRSMMIYERIMNTTFSPNGLTEVMVYFFSTILASSKGIDLTFDEFVDWIDENPNTLQDFNSWLMTILERNGYITQKDEKGENVDEKKP